MAMVEKQQGRKHSFTINPIKTFGLDTLTAMILALLMNAPNKATERRAADPITRKSPTQTLVCHIAQVEMNDQKHPC